MTRKLIGSFLLLLTLTTPLMFGQQGMGPGPGVKSYNAPAWTKGFNFRGTSTFVTDGANETYVIADPYPTNRNSVTFGFTTAGMSTADRDATLDRRVAGINYVSNAGGDGVPFRVDLEGTGSHTVCIALGDASGTHAYEYVQVRDDSTVLFTIDDTDGTAEDHWDDAAGIDRAPASTWAASNTCVTHTFATTTFIMVVAPPSVQAAFSTIAHLSITKN